MRLTQQCILAIGDTGNGKSFTANIFGANAKVGDTSISETDEITIYNIKGGFYIDTPGFNDTDEEKKDEKTVHLIFLKMMESNIQNITTILWFVTPDIRARGSYKRQAQFIESLAKYHKGNAWDNTIIVTKGDQSSNSDGPRDAAKEIARDISKTGEFKILLLESLPPTNIYVKGKFQSDELNEYGVFKASEPELILAKYESLMKGHLECPICLNLKKVKCSKCCEETDPRLAFPKCHLETESFHPNTENVHNGNVIDNHPFSYSYKHSDRYVEARTRYDFDHSPPAWVVRVATIGIVNPHCPAIENGYWNCCHNNDANSRGCKAFYPCCGNDIHSSGCQKIYDVCRHKCEETGCLTICKNCKKKLDEKGCKERCKNCKNENSCNIKGCIEIPHNWL
ncbi:hypothetical protein GLOIN_2v1513485, partial [Rhizophagus irregularis DAOM 181602=DAOM 197198]